MLVLRHDETLFLSSRSFICLRNSLRSPCEPWFVTMSIASKRLRKHFSKIVIRMNIAPNSLKKAIVVLATVRVLGHRTEIAKHGGREESVTGA